MNWPAWTITVACFLAMSVCPGVVSAGEPSTIIVEGNLFDASRSPRRNDPAPASPPSAASKTARPAQPPPLLLGVAMHGTPRQALLAPPPGNAWRAPSPPGGRSQKPNEVTELWVAEGCAYLDWILEKVERSHVVLRQGENVTVVALYPDFPDKKAGKVSGGD